MSNGNGWMPLYIGDYLGDTMELDGAQHGAYLLLLMYYWRNGPLPVDDAKLAQIARTDLRAWKKTVGPVVKAFFREDNGRLHQKRADLELAKAAECHERAVEKRTADNDRLKAWRAKQASNGHPHTHKPNGHETRFTGVSPPVSERVAKCGGNADETRRTVHTDTDRDSTEKKKDIYKNPLSLRVLDGSGTREDEAASDEETEGQRVEFVGPPSANPTVAAHINRTAKTCAMRIPYAEVRDRFEQIAAAVAEPEPADEPQPPIAWGRLRPAEMPMTPAEQYAALMGCSLAEARLRVPAEVPMAAE